jgi:photosystem II stability/assembly factor-like uncharacterized protein
MLDRNDDADPLRDDRRPALPAIASLLVCVACVACRGTPQPELQSGGTTNEFRGLSAASETVVWAAGRNGAYARTTDGGATWHADSVPGASELFFIDVHAVDQSTAYLLGTHFEGGEARIYKTTDGGGHWALQYRDTTPGVFFDGMAFWDGQHGVAFSDPVDGSFLIIRTDDAGATWEPVPPENIPPPLPGEAGFAASGTAIAVWGTEHAWFGTGGGTVARVFRSSDRGRSWTVTPTPLPGNVTAGIFGIAFRDSLNGVAVGGNYTKPQEPSDNVIRTRDGGLSWTIAGGSLPAGVRYGVTYVPGTAGATLVASGPSGWGYSRDDGTTWAVLEDSLGYNTVSAAHGGVVWAAGTEGRVAAVYLQPH